MLTPEALREETAALARHTARRCNVRVWCRTPPAPGVLGALSPLMVSCHFGPPSLVPLAHVRARWAKVIPCATTGLVAPGLQGGDGKDERGAGKARDE